MTGSLRTSSVRCKADTKSSRSLFLLILSRTRGSKNKNSSNGNLFGLARCSKEHSTDTVSGAEVAMVEWDRSALRGKWCFSPLGENSESTEQWTIEPRLKSRDWGHYGLTGWFLWYQGFKEGKTLHRGTPSILFACGIHRKASSRQSSKTMTATSKILIAKNQNCSSQRPHHK